MKQSCQTACILVGGKGTRLKPLVTDKPKPLVLVGGEPFLDLLLENLKTAGVKRFLLLAGYRANDVVEYAKSRQARFGEIEVVTEEVPLGTAGALAHCSDRLKNDESFLLVNGDTLVDADLKTFLEQSLSKSTIGRVLLSKVQYEKRFGNVEWDPATKLIKTFKEKSYLREGLVNAGIYLFSREILNHLPEKTPSSLETEILTKLANENKIEGFPVSGEFIDIGIPETYARLHVKILNEKMETLLSKSLLTHFAYGIPHFVSESIRGKVDGEVFQTVLKSELETPLAGRARDGLIVAHENERSQLIGKWDGPIFFLSESPEQNDELNLESLQTSIKSYIMAREQSLWVKNWMSHSEARRPALFLDRDGVLIDYVDYLKDPKDLKLKSNVVALVKECNAKGIPVILVSNQAGVGKKKFQWIDLDLVTRKMHESLCQSGCWLDDVFYSYFVKSSADPIFLQGSHRRKPGAGMFFEAAQKHRIELSDSIMIGDRLADLHAAKRAGLKNVYWFENDRYNERKEVEKLLKIDTLNAHRIDDSTDLKSTLFTHI